VKRDKRKGARSVLIEDQPSFADDHSRRGKHFTDGRKVRDLDRVGAMAPDTDPDRRPA